MNTLSNEMGILFYDDSPVFGGHEVMSLLGVRAVLEKFHGKVHFLASSANTQLCDQVHAIAACHPNLTIITLDYHSSKLEAIRNHLLPSRIHSLAHRFRHLNPSLVVAIQGNIEHSSLALLAARSAEIPSTSYIPVPHSNAEMGAKFGALRDLVAARLFQVPDSFITITDEMATLLKSRGATAPIHIVYNGIDTSRFHPGDPLDACRQLNLPHDKTRIGMIGRIEFRQKQQHFLVQAVAADPALARSCHLVFAGNGPDRENLHKLIGHHHLSATILPWCDPALLYQAIDVLVIPSRYEGLPLVMLEALASGTPVLAADRDGMKDLLPSACRFQPNNPAALSESLAGFIARGLPKPDAALVDRVRNSMSLPAFRDAFASTILTLATRA